MQPEQVPLEHRHGHLANGANIAHPGSSRQQLGLVDVLVAGDVDDDGALLDPCRIHLVLVGWHTQDDDVGLPNEALGRGAPLDRLDLPAKESEGRLDVHAVDGRAVVRQHRGERPADNLGAVHDGDELAAHPIADGVLLVVRAQVLQDLDHGQGRAGQDALPHLLSVDETLVPVQRAAVEVAEALDILRQGHGVAKRVVVRPSVEARAVAEDGVVDHDPVHGVVLVGVLQGLLQVIRVDSAHLEAQPVPLERPAGPFGILQRRGVPIRQQAHELRPLALLQVGGRCLDLVDERLRDLVGRHLPRPRRILGLGGHGVGAAARLRLLWVERPKRTCARC
mmetsp:Transcript_90737/g.261455  ORF Transcript_90737/g.261455 Transcript_90737/m.261455 type:complete len:337 (+) Transcript_90737:237-1247(+)